MNLLVCGGAGYIGSHFVRCLVGHGHTATVFDNLSTGHAAAVTEAKLVVGDIRDAAALASVFAASKFDAVIHFGALSLVGASMIEPYDYYDNNVTGTLSLLRAMRDAGVSRFVFSSSAAVFGHPCSDIIDEDHPTFPINPYGATKLMVERILADASAAYGLRSVALRYFNAAGADPSGKIGESHSPETHLIPNVLKAALGGAARLRVFGTDYPTPDGSCVRDYVHVCDLAVAHLKSVQYMTHMDGAHLFNLGNGRGFSVLEVIASARRITGRDIVYEPAERRPGDPAVLVASSNNAHGQLGWSPAMATLDAIVETAWRWHCDPAY